MPRQNTHGDAHGNAHEPEAAPARQERRPQDAPGQAHHGREARAFVPPEPSSPSPRDSRKIDTPEEAEATRRAYDPNKYDRPSVSVDILVFTVRRERLEVLLVLRRHWPYEGMWAIPGGFVNSDEDLETAARRELFEETAMRDVTLEQVHTFGAPHRNPATRVISVAHAAFVPPDTLSRAGDDAAETCWFPADDLPPLAFDHADILAFARQFFRERLGCAPVGKALLPEEFQLRQYLDVAAAIAGQPFERQAVRKRLLASGILARAGYTPGGHVLYRFAM